MENGTAHKADATSIHVNPMFNSGNNNKLPTATTNQPQVILPVNDAVASLPSTPARGRTQSEPRTGTPRRTRANSTGNVSRSHERHQNHGIINYSEEKVRLPRHLSAGNVSHQHRQAAHSDHASQNQSPAKTLPRQRSATANDPYYNSPVRNPLYLQQERSAPLTTANGASGVINNVPKQQSPARFVPNGAVVNQYSASSGTLDYNQPSQGGVSQQLSPSKSPQHGPFGQAASVAAGRGEGSTYQGNTLSVSSGQVQSSPSTQNSLLYHHENPTSPIKLSNSSNAPLAKETSLGTLTPYSSHRDSPNITTNPNYNTKSGDICQTPNEAKLGQKEPSARSLGSDHSFVSGGILHHRSNSSEASTAKLQNASKGTLRAPSTGELLSPLDALPDAYLNNPGLRYSGRHLGNSSLGTSSLQSFPPPPSEQPIDSSDDDLYSIVAKGTYSSAVPDPHLRHTGVAASDRREGKNKNKHVYVVVPLGDGSTAV